MPQAHASLLLTACFLVSAAALHAQTQPTQKQPQSTKTLVTGAIAAPNASQSAAALSNPKTPAEIFSRARQLSDLEASGIPFHLKATFVATAEGQLNGNGTYEEWWVSTDQWRKEATLGNFRWVSVQRGSKPIEYSSPGATPVRLRQGVNAALMRIAPDAGTHTKWKVGREKVNRLEFKTLSAPYPGPNTLDLLARRDFFTPEGVLRIRQTPGMVTVYNNFEKFQNLVVPFKIDVSSGTNPWLAITIDTLEPVAANDELLAKLSSIPNDLQPAAARLIVVSSGVMQSKIIHQVPPIYPMEAKISRIQGTVVLAAVINEEGNIEDLHVLHSAGALLDAAAFQAVRQWRYRPTMLVGVPVKVNTQISVVFTLNR